MRIYFDTETTGIPNRNLPWNHPRQPSIVSLAWVLVADDWHEGASHHHLIKPDGWTISPEAEAVHHISLAQCEAEGEPLFPILQQFKSALEDANEIYAYNIQFDIDMITIACDRYETLWPNWPVRFDIMPQAQAYCQLPPTERMLAARRTGFKPPKLSEALRIICGEEFPDAHDALADVRATIKIHRKLSELLQQVSL